MEMPFLPAKVVPETQARDWLRAHFGGDGLEAWLAKQTWQTVEDGSWRVESDRDGWTYRVEAMLDGGLRVVARAPEAGPVTSWLIG
jgi:hypothetical protein